MDLEGWEGRVVGGTSLFYLGSDSPPAPRAQGNIDLSVRCLFRDVCSKMQGKYGTYFVEYRKFKEVS